MPIILTKRTGSCTACGGYIVKGEEAYFTAATGIRHPEKACSQAAGSGYRRNRHPGTCACGVLVEKGQGSLVLAGEEKRGDRFKKQWEIRCERCR